MLFHTMCISAVFHFVLKLYFTFTRYFQYEKYWSVKSLNAGCQNITSHMCGPKNHTALLFTVKPIPQYTFPEVSKLQIA